MKTIQAKQRFKVDQLEVCIFPALEDMAQAAAKAAAEQLSAALQKRGEAAAILATGNSQIQFLNALVELQKKGAGLDWSKITLFHMDEYLGLPQTHKASFRKYMKEKVEALLKPKVFHYIHGDAMEPLDVCDEYSRQLTHQPIDLCCLGVGENGHLAFNDPPVADFQDPRLVKIVLLDQACRQQQVGEGHFATMNDVPQYAISLTIPALCMAKRMLCIAPEKRKAKAILGSLTGPISTDCPGSFLRKQSHCTLYLDPDSASLLPEEMTN